MKKITHTTLMFALCFLYASVAHSQQFNVLLITRTVGWHHESINEAVDAFRTLSAKHLFKLTWEENVDRVITPEALKEFDVLVFLLTSGDILNEAQQKAVEKFIQSGKGFVGVHSASDTEYDWPWYNRLVGHMFHIHPVIQTGKLQVHDRNFPGLERFPNALWWTDEWYEFGPAQSKNLRYLLKVDESSYDTAAEWGEKKGKGMGNFHPISWYQEFDGGRSFYTALGHLPAAYSDRLLMEHIYGGLFWAATGKGLQK